MTSSRSRTSAGLPYYDEPSLHMNLAGQLWAWEFEGWKPESMSWKTGCYIHGGLSRQQTVFRGPDVKEFFSSILVNSLENFHVGLDEARDLLQRGRAHDGPRDPPAQRRARVPLLRRPALAALPAAGLGGPLPRRDGADAVVPLPDRRARRRWRRSSAPPARACATSPSCASATRRSTARPSRSAASA